MNWYHLLQRGGLYLILLSLLCGCSIIEKISGSNMTPDEEKHVREAAIQYIRDTYNKELVIEKITKDRVFGNSYYIDGVIKDGQNTPVYITGTPGNFRDTYVVELWSNELTPHITKLINQHLDVRKMEEIVYSDGTKKTSYTGDIPSVFEVLEKGEKDFSLNILIEIYEQNGQYEKGISQLLHELRKMNFNKVTVTVFVYEDKLKVNPNKENPHNEHLLYRYNISGDIQQIEIDNLEQYKTIIKE